MVRGLNAEHQQRFVEIESTEALIDFLADEHLKLTDDILDNISGGIAYWLDARSCAPSTR